MASVEKFRAVDLGLATATPASPMELGLNTVQSSEEMEITLPVNVSKVKSYFYKIKLILLFRSYTKLKIN